jgi:hypothetical protein
MHHVLDDVGSLCSMEHMKHHETSQMKGITKGPNTLYFVFIHKGMHYTHVTTNQQIIEAKAEQVHEVCM